MLSIDAAYAADRRWLPAGWAVPQLALGIFDLVVAESFLSTSRNTDGDLLAGLIYAGLGLWFVTHAVMSLLLDDYVAPTESPTRAEYRPTAW